MLYPFYQDLVEQYAFEHKYNSVKRFCRALRKKDPRQYDRLEFGLGEEVTVWKDTTHGRTYAPVVVSPFLFLLFIEEIFIPLKSFSMVKTKSCIA